MHLSKVAGKIPGSAKLVSITRRLSRFLDNPAVQVREWYEPIARPWLQAQWHCLGEIRLIVDGTKVGFGHQLLLVSLAYRKRAIPIAWTWVGYVRGHSTAFKQLALLNYVRKLLPANAVVFLVGDCEFGSVEVLQVARSVALVLCLAPKIRHYGLVAPRGMSGNRLAVSSTRPVKVVG